MQIVIGNETVVNNLKLNSIFQKNPLIFGDKRKSRVGTKASFFVWQV